MGAAPQRTILKALGIRVRQSVEAAHERWFFPKADALLCVSESDWAAYARFVPKERIHLVPNFVDVPDVYGGRQRTNRVIMTTRAVARPTTDRVGHWWSLRIRGNAIHASQERRNGR